MTTAPADAGQPHQPLSYDQAHQKLAQATVNLRRLERDYGAAQAEAAAAEATYRLELAQRYSHHREEGKAQDESNTLARADVAHLSFLRDEWNSRVAKLAIQMENRRGERASLHRLVDWSAALDATQARVQDGPGRQAA